MGSSAQKKRTRLAGWVARDSRNSGVGGSHNLDGRHAAQELGARMEPAGTRLRSSSWGPAEFGWVARGFGPGCPKFWCMCRAILILMDYSAKSCDWGFSAHHQAGNNSYDFQYTRNGNFFIYAIKRNRTSAILGCKLLMVVFNPPHHSSFSRHWFRRTSQSRILSVFCFFIGPTLRQRMCRHAERRHRCLWNGPHFSPWPNLARAFNSTMLSRHKLALISWTWVIMNYKQILSL